MKWGFSLFEVDDFMKLCNGVGMKPNHLQIVIYMHGKNAAQVLGWASCRARACLQTFEVI